MNDKPTPTKELPNELRKVLQRANYHPDQIEQIVMAVNDFERIKSAYIKLVLKNRRLKDENTELLEAVKWHRQKEDLQREEGE